MTAPMEQWATGPGTPRWPGGSWVRRNKVLVTLIPALLTVLVAGVSGPASAQVSEPQGE